jgi:predicted alpha/beta-fold hydrolase
VKELSQMSSKNVFQPIAYWTLSQQQLKTALPSLAFLKQKFKADGTPEKVKARLESSRRLVGTHSSRTFVRVLSPMQDVLCHQIL